MTLAVSTAARLAVERYEPRLLLSVLPKLHHRSFWMKHSSRLASQKEEEEDEEVTNTVWHLPFSHLHSAPLLAIASFFLWTDRFCEIHFVWTVLTVSHGVSFSLRPQRGKHSLHGLNPYLEIHTPRILTLGHLRHSEYLPF